MGLMVNDSSLWEPGFQVVGGLLRFANLSRFTPAPPGQFYTHLKQFSKKPELVEICLSCYSPQPFPYSHVAGRF